jgi:hypothetical protein
VVGIEVYGPNGRLYLDSSKASSGILSSKTIEANTQYSWTVASIDLVSNYSWSIFQVDNPPDNQATTLPSVSISGTTVTVTGGNIKTNFILVGR